MAHWQGRSAEDAATPGHEKLPVRGPGLASLTTRMYSVEALAVICIREWGRMSWERESRPSKVCLLRCVTWTVACEYSRTYSYMPRVHNLGCRLSDFADELADRLTAKPQGCSEAACWWPAVEAENQTCRETLWRAEEDKYGIPCRKWLWF